MIRIGRHILLFVLLTLACRPLVAQERAELEQRYQNIIERPIGVTPAIGPEEWDQLIQMALNAPLTSVTLQTKPGTRLMMKLDKEHTYCIVSVSGQLTYELLVAPWRIHGEQPLLQITTLEKPYRVSMLTAFLPKKEKYWEISPVIDRTEWLRAESTTDQTGVISEFLMSRVEKIPLVLTFDIEQCKRAVRISATPSLEGWTTREMREKIEQLIHTLPLYYQLTRRGTLKRIK